MTRGWQKRLEITREAYMKAHPMAHECDEMAVEIGNIVDNEVTDATNEGRNTFVDGVVALAKDATTQELLVVLDAVRDLIEPENESIKDCALRMERWQEDRRQALLTKSATRDKV